MRDAQWNFEKFLFGRNGKAIRRYKTSTKVMDIEAAIIEALAVPPPPPADKEL